jgi:hypothetical protein
VSRPERRRCGPAPISLPLMALLLVTLPAHASQPRGDERLHHS